MASLREELSDLFQGWPPLWARCRRQGLVRSLPDLALSVGLTIAMFSFFILLEVWDFSRLAWSFINPRSPRHRERRERNYERQALSKLFLAAPDHSVSLFAPATEDERPGKHRTSLKPCLLFDRVPIEVRRHILLLAFGDRTLHMDLRFRKRLNLVLEKPYEGWDVHARILDYLTPVDAQLLASESSRWRWFGCVCHRFPPEGPRHLSLGRRCNNPWNHFREPDIDRCLDGAGECNKWPDKWPGKCQIGVLGWLLACRQA